MSGFDAAYILLFGFLLIVFALIAGILWQAVSPSLSPYLPTEYSTPIFSGVTNMLEFWNTDFAAIIVLMLLGSVVLALFAYSHPVMLLAWFMFNLVTIMLYFLLNNILTSLLTTLNTLNPGTMINAIAFFSGPLPLVILVFNVLMAIVLMGKRMQQPGGMFA